MGVLCSSAEGLSNAIIEGMAARLPMVVTDAGGNSELISHGTRGLLVPPERPSDLASAMLWMQRNRIAARQMGEAARAYVERKLSAERLASSHDLLYRSLVRSGHRDLAL
jgi:glycosyltransferase involved in cell wall biosynthesis